MIAQIKLISLVNEIGDVPAAIMIEAVIERFLNIAVGRGEIQPQISSTRSN